jgi:O-antigen ligase
MRQLLRYRHLPTKIGICTTIFLTFFWLRWNNAPPPFSPNYVMGFPITHLMLLTVLVWMLSGFPSINNFTKSFWRLLWAGSLLVLLGWITISQTWAYGLVDYSGLAPNAALQFALVTVFAITVACAAPAPRIVIGVLMLALIIHGIIGGLQVIKQGSIGLAALGELKLDPSYSGISVIQSGDMRWLRPYGLLPHPNIYAGVITVGLLASAAWILNDDKRVRWIGVWVFIFGLWILLLTFSRGAWLGFAIGILCALPFVIRQPQFWKRVLPVVGLSIAIGILFFVLFQPLLLVRAGIGEEGLELRSVSDRIVFNRIAREAIANYPIYGVGAGNFPWYSSVYIFYNTDYDLRGNNVHNIYLGIFAELGVIGFCLFVLTWISGIVAVLRQRNIECIALLGGIVAFAVIGLVDHYPFTMIHTQALWFGLLAIGIKADSETGDL